MQGVLQIIESTNDILDVSLVHRAQLIDPCHCATEKCHKELTHDVIKSAKRNRFETKIDMREMQPNLLPIAMVVILAARVLQLFSHIMK
jgi:hypothetical protein